MTKNKILMAALPLVFFVNSLIAANHPPKLIIDKGGFSFLSSYKLRIPLSSGALSSELIVKAQAASLSAITASYWGPIHPGPFGLCIGFHLHEVDGRISTFELQNGKQGIYREVNITPASDWYVGLHTLLKRFGCQFDPQRHKWKKYSILQKPKELPSIHIEPLPGCELHTTYNIRVAQYSLRSPLAGRVVVDVVAQEKILKNMGKNKHLVLKATFCTKKRATRQDPRSLLKFIKTKRGLREISRINIKRSSIWYPMIKKIIEKTEKRYQRYLKKHQKVSL